MKTLLVLTALIGLTCAQGNFFFQIFLVETIIPHHRGDPNLKLSDQDPHNSNHNNNNLDHNLRIDLLLKDNLLNNLSLKHSDNLLHKRPLGGLSLNLKQGLKNLKRLLYREMVLKHQ